MIFGFGKREPYILHIDDEAGSRALVKELVEVIGYDCQTVASVSEGRKAASDRVPALILLDGNMPQVDGFMACALFRGDPDLKSTPIIMLTSMQRVSDLDKAFEVGVTDYLIKPVQLPKLRDTLAKYLGAPEK